jgi:hypothetical protein
MKTTLTISNSAKNKTHKSNGKRTILGSVSAIAFACMSLAPAASMADTGDYSVVQTLWNITHPQAANNPVDARIKADMPFMNFIENEATDDGFKPKQYLTWQTIDLKADDAEHGQGAVKCMNGDDYKFLVKRSPSSSNMVIFLEGGGGCWDYESCLRTSGGQTSSGIVGGDNPGVALRAGSQSSLMTTSLRPNYAPKFKNWTKVYLPYCTQDLALGDSYNVYEEKGNTGNEIVASQRGMTVQGAVLTWLKANLEQPKQLLVTGQSAGGFGSELLYHTYRTALAPQQGYLINDAGPIMLAPQGESDELYPSQHAHKQVTESWNAQTYLEWLEAESSGLAQDQQFVSTNMGTISNFLSARWPNDRFALITSRKDHTISGFSYNSFFNDIQHTETLDERTILRDEKRFTEMENKKQQLDQLDNYGYLIPGYRPVLGGHVLTVPLIENSTTNEDDGNNVFDLIHSVMSENGRILESWEGDASLSMDINGRYDDCVNEYFRVSGAGDKAGDVYLNAPEPESNQLDLLGVLPCLENTHINTGDQYPVIQSVLPWLTQDVIGIEPLTGMASSEDILTEKILNLDQITAQQAAAIAKTNIEDAIRIGTAETQRVAAIAKAKADAVAKAAAEKAARIAAEVKARADAAAKAAAEAKARADAAVRAAAEAVKKAAAEAKARAKRWCGRWCRW